MLASGELLFFLHFRAGTRRVTTGGLQPQCQLTNCSKSITCKRITYTRVHNSVYTLCNFQYFLPLCLPLEGRNKNDKEISKINHKTSLGRAPLQLALPQNYYCVKRANLPRNKMRF
jgi:hypothetical protein